MRIIIGFLLLVLAVPVLAEDAISRLERDPFETASYLQDRPKSDTRFDVKAKKLTKRAKLKVKLKGVIWDSDTPVAIMEVQGDTQFLEKNESAKGFTLTEIEQKRVILNRNGQSLVLAMGTELLI